MEAALAAVAERALRCGARAGMDALLQQTLHWTGASGAALFDGRTCVARMGTGVARLTSGPGGPHVLEVWPDRATQANGAVLDRLAALGGVLVSAHARETAAGARQARLLEQLRAQERELANWERRRSRAAHDLRTPLMVIKGYLDMMVKGTAGPLNATVNRYLERMVRVAQDQRDLIDRRLGRQSLACVEDVRPLLQEVFRSPRFVAALALPDRPVSVRGGAQEVESWARELARGIASSGATEVSLRVDAEEATARWRFHARTHGGRGASEATTTRLLALTRRLRGELLLPGAGEQVWLARLPSEEAPREETPARDSGRQ
ncbi:histidine kinase [Myxococcus sp. K15C18031901]|uniref:histidine kinase dimerization/phospho-acceptor domain-containing protein n=1 Tax=Myxococcus dinghuensis TaxID=2906761 RepID=UPI0020A73A8A|nr:histidine kinase dimerization/phospho-acceptor domain-containing protein [Myxococcus dinghuensis]MCP3101740.1 histidine kinase [Myxococcus dinghuensis]